MKDTIEDRLSWDALYNIIDQLKTDEALLSNRADIDFIYRNTIMEFFDKESQTASYNTDAFRNIMTCLADLENYLNESAGYFTQYPAYQTVNGTFPYCVTSLQTQNDLRNGSLKLLSTTISDMQAFSSLKLLYGNQSYILCGYPSTKGYGVSVSSNRLLHVLSSTESPDGCTQIIQFLLSDEQQMKSALTLDALPVTESAFSSVLQTYTYTVYSNEILDMMEKIFSPQNLILFPITAHDISVPDYVYSHPEDSILVELTLDEQSEILSFLDGCTSKANANSILKSIIDEELSYWREDIRTLEETTKIIQSRVWIYLNE